MDKKKLQESIQKLNDSLTLAKAEGRKRAVGNIQKIIARLERELKK